LTSQADSPQILAALLQRIGDQGLPNFYGAQRFGKEGETLHMGLNLLRGEKAKSRNPFIRKLALSAVQSALFNHYLGVRLTDGFFRTVLPGDVMAKIPFGGMFVAEDVEKEQQRLEAREIVPSGPIFGRKTFAAGGIAAQREVAVLGTFELTPSSFGGFGKLVQGTRRHNLVYVADLAAEWEEGNLRLRFSLPAGSYATVLLRELLKNGLAGVEEE
jgi:tRNA pseudouridine13 synthase